MISKVKRARRKELRALANIRCFQHGLKNCDKYFCQSEVKKIFYGRKKKRKQIEAPRVGLDALFYRLKHPLPLDGSWDDFPEPETTPIATAPDLSVPTSEPGQVYLPSERKLTLRELISRKAAA